MMITSNVRAIMERKGVRIRAMAFTTGLSDKTILRARSERIVDCRLTTLQTIAGFLGCTVKELFNESTAGAGRS